jgi:hypothetical protein
MSTLNVGSTVQISGTNQKITGVLGAPGIIPTGSVIYTAANYNFSGTPRGYIPPGYLPCDGAYYSKTTYAELYAAIRDTFSTGSYGTALVDVTTGTTLTAPPAGNFRVPQLEGQFIRCWDGPVYTSVDPTTSGRIFGSYQADDFKSHTHTLPQGIAAVSPGTGVVQLWWNNGTTTNSGSAPTTGGLETRPKNIALLALIKY